ncbi:MAG: helicase-related protein [Bacteroidetes bacterium]|nr:helicase-related protein [Bacteroidota bacterium]
MIPRIILIDNSSENYSLGYAFKELISDPSFSQVAIASGYWDLLGMALIYDDLKSFLERENTSFRLLLGEEPCVRTYQVKNPENQDPEFPEKYFKKDLEELELKDEYQKVVDLLLKHTKPNGKLQIRVYRKNFLHAKCYIFGSVEDNAVGLLGSSNFTFQGLSGNLELNQLEDNNATVNYIRKNITQHPTHRSWFEELWSNSEAWTGIFSEEILDVSKHGSLCFSPYEMYIHALYRIYGQELLDEKENKVEPNDPASGKPQMLKFQIQNANSIIKKLERQGVAMLSDSVGLGKTYTAIKVIEYYQQTRQQRVVVITPAGLKSQWEKAFADFRFKNIPEILSMQDINKVQDRRETYKSISVGLFVFDESHNLRTAGGSRSDIFTQWKMENEKAHTLLVTATPINNQLSDLTNQIIIGTGGELTKLGFHVNDRGNRETIQERLAIIQKKIKTDITSGFIDYHGIREQLTPLLNKFIVKRTRQSIEKEFPDGLLINGILQKFPKSIPFNLEYTVSNQFKSELEKYAANYPRLAKAFQFTINSLAELKYLAHPLDLFEYYEKRKIPISSSLEIIYTGLLSLGFPCYRYNIYRWAYYGRNREADDFKLTSDENKELSRQIGIYGIFRTVFLKRLESSLFSIQKSVSSYEDKLLDFQKKLIRYNKIISVKNLSSLNKFIDSYNEQNAGEDELDFDFATFENREDGFFSIDADKGVFNIDQLKEDIAKDLAIIQVLKKQLDLLIKKDDKIQQLAKHLNQNDDRKVLIFTYFADTLKYLQNDLPQYLLKGRNVEFALGTKSEIENFARRFAPVAKQYTLKTDEREIDYLLATDKLSEGQNLQDSGMIVNYDLHWNPVRMIQRNGRINRLGSTFEEIYVYNFRPTDQLESYLQLVNKLQTKIDLIRYTVGTDQSVLDEEPIPQEFTEELYSRDEKKRLAALQKIMETTEYLGAEPIFLEDLRYFDNNPDIDDTYKEKIKNLPKGKWGKIQEKQKDDEFLHIAHLAAGEEDTFEAGFFVVFGKNEIGVMMSEAEGLNYIKTTSDNNKRFSDQFKNKVQTEEMIRNFIDLYDISEDVHNIRYGKQQEEAIAALITRMIEYGESPEIIEMVTNSILHSQNAYINRENLKLVKQVNSKIRKGEHFGSKEIERFKQLALQNKPEEKTVKVPLSEIIQIFA